MTSLAVRMALLITGLVLICLLPASVQGAPEPVKLELGGDGTASWNIANIKPGDTGIKTVILKNNAGTMKK